MKLSLHGEKNGADSRHAVQFLTSASPPSSPSSPSPHSPPVQAYWILHQYEYPATRKMHITWNGLIQ